MASVPSVPPLTIWYCDKCGGEVDAVCGEVLWGRDLNKPHNEQYLGYDILHPMCGNVDRLCCRTLVKYLLGTEGLCSLMALLADGPLGKSGSRCQGGDLHAFVDFVRRLHTPHYEEARRHFSDPQVREQYATRSQMSAYSPDSLMALAQRDPPGSPPVVPES